MTVQMTTSEIRAKILDRLETAVRRDIEKNGSDVISAGLRSTTDIAGYLYPQVPVSKVSRILNKMCLDGEIDWYGKDEGIGNVSLWRLALNEDNDDDGEPVVVELALVQDESDTKSDTAAFDIDAKYWFQIAA